jgi:acyl carrier protein
MSAPLLDRVRGIAADVLEIPMAEITLTSSPETIESWDSVHHLNLILALEQEFNIQFEPEETDHLGDIGKIVTAIGGKHSVAS